jgi:dTDP-D-glucose 4,6-dehydratase
MLIFMTDSKNQGIELTPRRILVTGGAGFIGSNFCASLVL